MIDEIYKLPSDKIEPATLQKILTNVHQNAVGVEYVSSVPTQVPFGKFVIYRSGTATRLYYQVGDGTIVYLTGTVV